MGFFGAIGNAVKNVGKSLVHPGWGGPAASIAKSFGQGPSPTPPPGAPPVEQASVLPAAPGPPANGTNQGVWGGFAQAAEQNLIPGQAPDMPGVGNLSPMRPDAGVAPVNGFDQNGVWQQGPGQQLQGGAMPGMAQSIASLMGAPKPMPTSTYGTVPQQTAAMNYANPGWTSGGRYGHRGVGKGAL